MEEMPLSTLTVQHRSREGSKQSGVTKREFLDFMIDGTSLLDMAAGDYVSCFVRGFPKQNVDACEGLFGADPAKPIGLYVCPECGDIGCGAVLTYVSRQDDYVVWSRLTWENGLTDEMYGGMREAFAEKQLGPFRFEANAYEATILAASRI